MNVLFSRFDESWHSEMIGRTAKEIGAQNVVTLSLLEHDLSAYVDNSVWINTYDIHERHYTFMEGKNLPALDAEILKQMRECEALYYPMLDRRELNWGIKVSYNERKRYYENDLRIVLWILDHYQIDMCVLHHLPHICLDWVLYNVCKQRNIPVVVGYFGPSIPYQTVSTYFLSDVFDHFPQLKNFKPTGLPEDKIQLTPRVQKYYDYYSGDRNKVVSVVRGADFIKHDTTKLQRMINLVKAKIEKGDLLVSIRRQIHNRFAERRLNRFYDQHATDKVEGKFLYYPLHYQPECTSLPMGGVYYDQLRVIRLISQNLPDDVTLCVKPHPNRNLLIDVPFYKEVVSLRNVKLMHPRTNTYELSDNALAVVSLTGTAIFESMLRGTPAMMFGYYVYQYAPCVFHCVTNEDCKKALETLCSGYKFDHAAVKEFLCELDKYLKEGSLYIGSLKMQDISFEDNLKNVTDALISYIQKNVMEKNAQ